MLNEQKIKKMRKLVPMSQARVVSSLESVSIIEVIISGFP